jgi:hypothetical protein
MAHHEGVDTHKEFICDDPACKDIALSIDGLTQELLGREVTEFSKCSFFCATPFEPLKSSNTKVCEDHRSVAREQDIVGVYVAVNQPEICSMGSFELVCKVEALE